MENERAEGVMREIWQLTERRCCQVGGDATLSCGTFVCHAKEDNGLGSSGASNCGSRFDQ